MFGLCRYCGDELPRARRPLEICAKCNDSPLCDRCGHERGDHTRVFVHGQTVATSGWAIFRQAQLGGASARASVRSAASCQMPPLQRPRHRTRTTHCPLRCGSHVHTKRRSPGRASSHLRRLPSKRTVRSLRRLVLSSSEYEIEVTVQRPAQNNHVIVERLETLPVAGVPGGVTCDWPLPPRRRASEWSPAPRR